MTARAMNGKQIIAGKIGHRVLFRKHADAAGENLIDEPQHLRVVDFACERRAQNCVVNRWEKLSHIALQNVTITPRKMLTAIQRAMRPFAFAIGVRIENERPLENRFDDVAQGVMHDAVTERRGGNQSTFRFVNVETGVRAGSIGLIQQFALQRDEIVFQPVLERGGGRAPAFAFCRFAIREQ